MARLLKLWPFGDCGTAWGLLSRIQRPVVHMLAQEESSFTTTRDADKPQVSHVSQQVSRLPPPPNWTSKCQELNLEISSHPAFSHPVPQPTHLQLTWYFEAVVLVFVDGGKTLTTKLRQERIKYSGAWVVCLLVISGVRGEGGSLDLQNYKFKPMRGKLL